MSQAASRTLGTCVYVTRRGADGLEVLMMYRHKEPNLGLWVAPGGKVELDESPRECALRELEEETGLRGTQILFRGLVTEISPLEHWQWLLFLYVVTEAEGEIREELREGRLQWIPVAELASLPIPQSDALFGPAVLDLGAPFFEATMLFDAELRLVEARVVGNGVRPALWWRI
ncbi:MAG: 8-oxo-dGTP diphosphatase [Ardenticatenales bacterium]|nr:8-oxo-dGTP diphosphatase [Ardenticatenales bacterium]